MLRLLLSVFEYVEIIEELTDSNVAVEKIINLKPDLIFLDIEMPGKNGFDIIRELSEVSYDGSEFIFVTGYDGYATKAFELAAFDYLLKPVDPSRIEITINRFNASRKNNFAARSQKLLAVLNKKLFRSSNGMIIIEPVDLLYIEADGGYSTLYFKNGREEQVSKSLGQLEEEFDSQLFFRVHRSVVINLKALIRVDTKKRRCWLAGNNREVEVSIARDRISALNKIL